MSMHDGRRGIITGPAEVYVRPLDPREGNTFEHVGQATEIQFSTGGSIRMLPECKVQAVCVNGTECLDAGRCLKAPS